MSSDENPPLSLQGPQNNCAVAVIDFALAHLSMVDLLLGCRKAQYLGGSAHTQWADLFAEKQEKARQIKAFVADHTFLCGAMASCAFAGPLLQAHQVLCDETGDAPSVADLMKKAQEALRPIGGVTVCFFPTQR